MNSRVVSTSFIQPEGAYIHNNELFVYYGAADKYIALAKIEIDELLDELAKYLVKDQ